MNLHFLKYVDRSCLVGHPFSPTGRGEDVRSTYRALRAVGCTPSVYDIYDLDPRLDAGLSRELSGALTAELSHTINIFHVNGDEIEQVVSHLGGLPHDGINVVYPTWELPRYPPEWAAQLDRFDEIWAPSRFVMESLLPVVSTPVIRMPLACEPKMYRFFDRSHFSIPDSALAFLFLFDFTSFVARKNPFAALDAIISAQSRCPNAGILPVLKLNRGHLAPIDYEAFKEALTARGHQILLIDDTYTKDETLSLIRCCDVFVSLHRSEGFGRGMAEAMALGKPVVATRWSGNMEFMNPDVACLVDYQLIPVESGEYPFAEGQKWASPDVDQAADCLSRLARSPELAASLGRRANRHVRVLFSHRSRGICYANHMVRLLEERHEQSSNALSSSRA